MITPLFRATSKAGPFKTMFSQGLMPRLRASSKSAAASNKFQIMPRMGVVVGAGSGIYLASRFKTPTILNDAVFQQRPGFDTTGQAPTRVPVKSRFGGKLNYQELTVGSVTGLVLGIVAGKLSSAIVFLTLAGYLLTQFLENKGIVTIPWKQFVNIGSERINVKQLVLNQPSFKISFVLTFLIAAFNV